MTKNCWLAVLELYEWELREIPFANSVIGRHVYFCLARQILRSANSDVAIKSVKATFSSPNFTDRAIRLKLRQLEQEGYLTSGSHREDRRARQLIATDKLMALVQAQAAMLERLLEREFIVLPK